MKWTKSLHNGQKAPQKLLTPGEFTAQMKEITVTLDDDTEFAHMAADELLGNVLEYLGYYEGVKIFNDMPKWYA